MGVRLVYRASRQAAVMGVRVGVRLNRGSRKATVMGVLLTKPLDLGLPSWVVVVVADVAPSTMVGRYDAYVPGRQLPLLSLKK
jgi:hypothetical protein